MNNEWIPVSERLPEKDGYYICSLTDLKYYNSFIKLMIFNADNKIFESFYDVGGYYDILAWMELPTPYEKPTKEIEITLTVPNYISDERILNYLLCRLDDNDIIKSIKLEE